MPFNGPFYVGADLVLGIPTKLFGDNALLTRGF